MIKFNITKSLFDELEEEEYKCLKEVSLLNNEEVGIVFNEKYLCSKESRRREMRVLNKHLLPINTPVEGKFQLPKVQPFTGEIPDVFIPYSAKVPYNSQYTGVYCNIHDSGFSSTWSQPVRSLNKVRQYLLAVAPDYTLWADGRICENIEQLRKSRTTQCFWQNNGVPTIQTASWSDADSILTYAFDGLAEESWTAIGHQRKGNKAEQHLFKFAVKTLIERKHPIGLLVFGVPLNFDPGVPVVVKPSFISKLRKL